MPTVLSHAIFTSALVYASTTGRVRRALWVSAAACSVLPDLDVIAFTAGIPYASMWGHRGITHSLLFAIGTGFLLAWANTSADSRHRVLSLGAVLSLATLSHAALDALTNGGLGVALWAPFHAARYFAPWRPIQVSPIGPGFFGERGLRVLRSELLWVWLPALLLFGVGTLRRRLAPSPNQKSPSANDAPN